MLNKNRSVKLNVQKYRTKHHRRRDKVHIDVAMTINPLIVSAVLLMVIVMTNERNRLSTKRVFDNKFSELDFGIWRSLSENTKVDCLPGEENNQPLNSDIE